MELTRKAIIEWLKQQPEELTMGSAARYDCDCVVACYLHDQGYPEARVGMKSYWLEGNHFEEGTPLPPDVRGLVDAFDDIPGYDHTPSEVLWAVAEDEEEAKR